MQVKTRDRVLLQAQAKAEPADNVITRDYYASLPQIRLTGAASGNPTHPNEAVEIILDGNDLARLVECALRHPQPNMRYGVLAAIWNHPELVPADFRVRAQGAGGVFGNPENRGGGTGEKRPTLGKARRRRRIRAPNHCCPACRRRRISEAAADS